jgi:hypothetical protein
MSLHELNENVNATRSSRRLDKDFETVSSRCA